MTIGINGADLAKAAGVGYCVFEGASQFAAQFGGDLAGLIAGGLTAFFSAKAAARGFAVARHEKATGHDPVGSHQFFDRGEQMLARARVEGGRLAAQGTAAVRDAMRDINRPNPAYA